MDYKYIKLLSRKHTAYSFLIDLYNLKHLVERLRCIWDFLNAMWKIWTFKVETYFKIRIIQETVTFGYRFGSEEGCVLLPVCSKYKVRLPVVNFFGHCHLHTSEIKRKQSHFSILADYSFFFFFFKIYLNWWNKSFFSFFNCYLAAPQPTLIHYQGGNLTHTSFVCQPSHYEEHNQARTPCCTSQLPCGA